MHEGLHIDKIHTGLATVSMAVAASSAFPGFFPPLELSSADVGVTGGDFGRQAYTDGGKTWQKVLYKDENTGAIDLVMDPHNPSVLFAALWEARRQPWNFSSGGPGSGLYRSEDGGLTWLGRGLEPGKGQSRRSRCAAGTLTLLSPHPLSPPLLPLPTASDQRHKKAPKDCSSGAFAEAVD